VDIRVPDVYGETRKAWRAWKIGIEPVGPKTDITLRSINQKNGGKDELAFRWIPKEIMRGIHNDGLASNKSRVDEHSDDDTPYEGCACGIHAMDSPLFLAKTGYVSMIGPDRQTFLWGELEMWGKVIEGETGIKAQFAYPKRFYMRWDLALSMENENGITTLDFELLKDILEQQWGVPVVVAKSARRASEDSNDVLISEFCFECRSTGYNDTDCPKCEGAGRIFRISTDTTE
jgi:hypothetical protein